MKCKQQLELVIAGPAWAAGLRPALLEPGRYAVGEVRRQEMNQGCRLLVERLESVDHLPRGAERPSLSDWCLIRVVDESGKLDPAELIRQATPRASQGVVAMVLRRTASQAAESRRLPDDPPGATDCRAAWFYDGEITPIRTMRVVGPGMLCVEMPTPSPSSEPDESDNDLGDDRWSRTIGSVGPRVFRKIRQSRVTLIGAGRNGSQVAWQLAALGVPFIRLVDADVLEAANLNAMPGLDSADIGCTKVEALAERLIDFRPDLVVTMLARSITEGEVLDQLRRMPSHLIVSAVDSDAARLAAGLLARETLTPHLDLGTHIASGDNGRPKLTGDARLLLPGQGCVACVGGLAERDEAFYELAAPPKSLHRGPAVSWRDQRLGSLVTLNAMTCGAAVQLWLDLLAGALRNSFWQRLRWTPGSGIEAHSGTVGAGKGCPFCNDAK